MFLGYQFASSGFEMMVMIQTTIEMAIMLTEGKSILENIKKIADLKGWNIALINQALKLVEGKLSETEKAGERHESN
jgi:hypothetical protein